MHSSISHCYYWHRDGEGTIEIFSFDVGQIALWGLCHDWNAFSQDILYILTPWSCETCALHVEAVRYLDIKIISSYKCWISQWLVAWDHNLLCKSNILPFAVQMLIAECKDNAYLYREETPINKVLKFSVYSRAVLNKCDPNFKGHYCNIYFS